MEIETVKENVEQFDIILGNYRTAVENIHSNVK